VEGVRNSVKSIGTTASNKTIIVPRILTDPILGGSAVSRAYEYGAKLIFDDSNDKILSFTRIFHSGRNLYIYFSGLSTQYVHKIIIRSTIQGRSNNGLGLGDCEFSVNKKGKLCLSEANDKGDFLPLLSNELDFTATILNQTNKSWDVELRINLEWLGGYSRIDKFLIRMMGTNNRLYKQWPKNSNSSIPSTWGNLVLTPLYNEQVKAGSVYINGRESYLVIPRIPNLKKKEFTIEIWVYVIDDGIGTLISNGKTHSYWLGINKVVEFGSLGEWSIFGGQISISKGWHHIAVTVTKDGENILYVDGVLDRRYRLPYFSETVAKPNELRPKNMQYSLVRIGFDRDDEPDQNLVQSYVSEIRIWNRKCTLQEICENAFVSLLGKEYGLIGLWLFDQGLKDIAKNNDAGLIGNASLALKKRDIMNFDNKSTSITKPVIRAQQTSLWDVHIPMSSNHIIVDGVCGLLEYKNAATINLEPDKQFSLKAILSNDSLYICTSTLWGEQGNNDSLNIWINCHGQGGKSLGNEDLYLNLKPDGSIHVRRGNTLESKSSHKEFEVATITHKTIQLNNDTPPVNLPWWLGEIRIPLQKLSPFMPGQPLRLALKYKGTIPPDVQVEFPGGRTLISKWPYDFDENVPDTWLIVTTSSIETLSSLDLNKSKLPGSITDNMQDLLESNSHLSNLRESVK
jgi:Concanavalin A-like lectin/glucanases superfamily